MYRILIFLIAIFVSSAKAQDMFVPFTIDQLKYEQIDQAMSKISMPRDAHIAFQQMWQQLERQAIESQKLKATPK